MSRHRLRALTPGTVCVGFKPDGSKRFATFTAEHCSRYAEQGKAMLAKGLNVPVCWEHRADATPTRLSNDDKKSLKALGTAGHVAEVELDSANRVWVNVELPDEADAKQAAKVRFCSPEINRFTDGDGHDWGEVITHVALTPRPRQYDQPPIARLSLTGPIRLAFDPETGDDMAEEKEEKPAKKKADEEMPEVPQVDEKIKGVIEALKEIGMNIPDEVIDAEGLIIAIKAANAPEEEPLEAPEDGNELPANVSPSNAAPIGLSHASTGAEKKAYDRIAAVERKELTRRAERLVKAGLAPVVANKIKASIGKIQLSFGNDGEMLPNAVTIKLESLEEATRAGGWKPRGKRVQLSHAGITAVDDDIRGERDDENVLADWDKT